MPLGNGTVGLIEVFWRLRPARLLLCKGNNSTGSLVKHPHDYNKRRSFLFSLCSAKEDWHRPDPFKPTVQMWRLIRAAAESGRRRVRSGKTSEPVRQLLLQTDLNPQLRLLTSPVSSLSASPDCSSQKENKKLWDISNCFSPSWFTISIIQCWFNAWHSSTSLSNPV